MDNVQQQKKPRDVSGCNNPMFGRKHSQQSKEKMSQAATLRNQRYKKALDDAQHHITMDEFLSNNPSIKEYIKTLAQRVIKEEINKLVWRKQQNQRVFIPL